MTRLFLAAGVAALAISAPVAARPHNGGDNERQQISAARGGGGERPQVQRGPRQSINAQQRGGGQARADRQQVRAERFAQRPAQTERFQSRMAEPQQVRSNRVQAQNRVAERQQVRANRVPAPNRIAERQQVRVNRPAAQNRFAERQQARANDVQAQNRMTERQQLRVNRVNQVQNRMADRTQFRADRQAQTQNMMAQRQQFRADRQILRQGAIADRQALRADRIANVNAFRASRLAALTDLTPRTRVYEPAQVVQFVGRPLSAVTPLMALRPLPSAVSYLYPDTPDYYYQYGGGYLYQVDRGSNLISALLPLLTGGYMPGSYLPNNYMNSYVPSYWGLNSFYPSSYDASYGYGYGYNNLCNRYANGVVYQVDCMSGMIVDAIPTYAGGYGVGQMLPSAYEYYNVPNQYRSLYYDTPDYNYWYAPGAIYQYDPGSSLITSVAALLSPGFSVGQPLPMGYSTYNVPYAYRSTYYDTPDAWYRYNNGYIYQVNPTTQLVTAIVASILS